jgi:hypothetical protein
MPGNRHSANNLRKSVRIFGAARQKPGFPLQSFFAASPQKKDFRFNPLRPTD